MRLVCFNPVGQRSAIAKVAHDVAHSLAARGHTVVTVSTETEYPTALARRLFPGEILHWSETHSVNDALATSDATLYHVGDHFPNHQGCIEWMPRAPGVVCLHDFFLGHLFYGWASGTPRNSANQILDAWYGAAEREQFWQQAELPTFVAETCETTPMTEWVCSQALGVITHSAWGVGRVLESCAGPIRIVPLPWTREVNEANTASPLDSERFNIVTVGHINRNKRPASVIRAIASSEELRSQATFHLAGHCEPGVEKELADLAADLDVRLQVHGAVHDDLMNAIIDGADVVVALRFPWLEAASASAIEALLASKPLVVIRGGFYSELPDSCAFKVDSNNEVSDLQGHLERLLADSDLRTEVGRHSAEWARSNFRPSTYADAVVETCAATRTAALTSSVIQRASDQLARWSISEPGAYDEFIVEPLLTAEARPDREVKHGA